MPPPGAPVRAVVVQVSLSARTQCSQPPARSCDHRAHAREGPFAVPHMNRPIPESFSAMVAGRAPEPQVSGDEWLLQLPRLVEASLAEWDLTLDGDPMHGVWALGRTGRRSAPGSQPWPLDHAARAPGRRPRPSGRADR